ncbi:MAG: class I SAM-dependent methyltransferase [Candidatus Omnitrophota bacterium]
MKRNTHWLEREKGVYGKCWNDIHDGYFADSGIARPLIEKIEQAIAEFTPSFVADLGGGTGFILKELLQCSDYAGTKFVNIDLSAKQVRKYHDSRITSLVTSVIEVKREQIGAKKERLMLIMRSVLHYFGRTGISPFLKHIRGLLEPGETFIHQTACFERKRDAECLNLLYKLMRTDKWYPTKKELKTALEEEYLTVQNICLAPRLCLKPEDLAKRYRLTRRDVINIRREVSRSFGEIPNVFALTEDGFIAYLHYQIFTCLAV